MKENKIRLMIIFMAVVVCFLAYRGIYTTFHLNPIGLNMVIACLLSCFKFIAEKEAKNTYNPIPRV